MKYELECIAVEPVISSARQYSHRSPYIDSIYSDEVEWKAIFSNHSEKNLAEFEIMLNFVYLQRQTFLLKLKDFFSNVYMKTFFKYQLVAKPCRK